MLTSPGGTVARLSMLKSGSALESAGVSDRAKRLYRVLRLVLVSTVLVTVWAPHFLHYRIDRRAVPVDVLQVSLRVPASAVLEEVSGMSLGVGLDIPGDKIVGIAEQILGGSLPAPRFLAVPLPLRGYPQDYQFGPSTLQLVMASLEVEKILLSAFEKTQDQRFLQLAIRRILDFAVHEVGQRQGIGFLWNDHAVGARISVLTRLWRHVRATPDLPAASSREILSLVERSGRLLAKPGHFTVRTNHGVIQNLALLQISAAFPALAESGTWRNLAIERLSVQLPFYVSSEGVVLEHSAEYHLFGTELLAMAVRLSVLNGLVPEPLLRDAADKSRQILGRLMRPDGTLPLLGNTSAGKGNSIPVSESDGSAPIQHMLPPHPSPLSESSLFPVAGYAIWWQTDDSRKLAQTLIAWAKHDGHGHKHADEGSVLFWSGGVDWVTNTGYWPYDARNGAGAYSWTGSNAPHERSEQVYVPRSVQLLTTGEASDARFIEVERRNKDGAQFRRQVLQLDAQTLLVLDFAHEVSKGTETIWTVDPALRLSRGAADNTFTSSAGPDGQHLTISSAPPTTAKLQILRGSERPFAGWVVVNNTPTPADALRIVDRGSHSASAILFKVDRQPMKAAQKIFINPGATAQEWDVFLEGVGVPARLSRRDSTITLGNVADSKGVVRSVTLTLRPAPDIAAERAALKSAYAKAVNIYPPWRELSFYRFRLTYAIGVLALLIEAGWFAMSRRAGMATRIGYLYAHMGMAVCWTATSVWLFWFYLGG